jgi:hypothetical protein
VILCVLILAAIACRIAGPLPVNRPSTLVYRLAIAALDDDSWRESVKAERDSRPITTLDAIELRETLASPVYQAARVHRSLRLDAYPPVMRGRPADPRIMFADWSRWTVVVAPLMGQPIARRVPGASLAGVAA